MKKSLYLAFFLAVVSAIAGVILAYANSVTAPIIAANQAAKEAESFAGIFGDATAEVVEFDAEAYPEIQTILDYGSEGVGYKVSVQGRNDKIIYIVGVKDGTIIGYSIVSQGETNGIGSLIAESDFIDTVTGSAVDASIDTISGATISSSAVIEGISEVAEHYAANY